MRKAVSFLYIVILLSIGGVPALAGQTTLTTYYPAPDGNYNHLTANNVGIAQAIGADVLDITGNTSDTGNITASGYVKADILDATGAVAGATGTAGSYLFYNQGGSGEADLISNKGAANGGFWFYNTPVMTNIATMDGAGRLSLGLTWAAANNGSGPTLQVAGSGAGYPSEALRIQASSSFLVARDGAGTPRMYLNNDAGPALNFYGGDAVGPFNFLSVDNSGTRNITLNATTTGKVGIGVAVPAAELQVKGPGTGSALIGTNGCGGNYTSLSLNGNADTTCGNYYNILSNPTDLALYINRPTGNAINFRENNVTQMQIATGGATTITGVAGGINLLVNGRIEANEATNGGLWANSANTEFVGDDSGAGVGLWDSANGWTLVVSGSTTTINGDLVVSGNITAPNGCITSSPVGCASDRRFKNNIVPLKDTLSKLDQLRGVSFEWNHLSAVTLGNKEGEKSIGMIAQELQKVYPELVGTIKRGKQEYLTIDYSKLSAVLLQSVKELKSQMSAMQDQINTLQEKVKILEKQK